MYEYCGKKNLPHNPRAFNTPLSPPLMLEAGNGTKFQLLPLFDIVRPFLGLTMNSGVRHDSHYV